MSKRLIAYDNNFIAPRLLRSIGVIITKTNAEDFSKALQEAKITWTEWSKEDMLIAMEQLCWAVFSQFITNYKQNKEIAFYKTVFEEFQSLSKVLPTYFQHLLKKENFTKEV